MFGNDQDTSELIASAIKNLSRDYLCMNCQSYVALDDKGRCEHCQSEAVDPAHRPVKIQNKARPQLIPRENARMI